MELTITERIGDMILDFIREIAKSFNNEDNKNFDMLVNRSDELHLFFFIYQHNLGS